jgi:hypothetical protein
MSLPTADPAEYASRTEHHVLAHAVGVSRRRHGKGAHRLFIAFIRNLTVENFRPEILVAR